MDILPASISSGRIDAPRTIVSPQTITESMEPAIVMAA